MTKPCAVPKCRTGYKSEKKKHSVFRVPNDPVRLQKWQEAIPGNVKLRATHVICDKHFEERYIRREWVKYDPNDATKIIARALYKYPQLSELAVPTKFDENLEDERAVATIMELGAPGPSEDSPKPIDPCVKAVGMSLNFLAPSVSENVEHVTPFTHGPSVVDDTSTNELPSYGNGEMSSGMEAMELEADPSEDAGNLVVGCASPMEQSPAANDVSNDGRTLNKNAKTYSVVSTVTISEKVQKGNSTTAVEYSTDIPNSWSATELCDEKGQRVVFQYIVTKADKGAQIPVLQKCVVLDSDRQLEYFVYGHLVDTQGTRLDRSLGEAASLRKTLQVFQHMGSEDVPMEDTYVDYVQQGRHNNCTLISKQKRCANCMKLRNRVLSRIRSMKTRPTLKRIHRKASTAFDNRKVVALLKRTAEERRSRKKAEGRVNTLTKELEEVREKFAHMEESTLQKKCSELNVPEAQRLALKEMIDAASRKDAKGRRYANEWMMLCMLMNIRSKGMYEFLRKNNVLPTVLEDDTRLLFSNLP